MGAAGDVSWQEVAEAFRRFDALDDGTIDQNELKAVMRFLDNSWSEPRLDLLLRAVGVDNRGRVPYERFCKLVFGAASVDGEHGGEQWPGSPTRNNAEAAEEARRRRIEAEARKTAKRDARKALWRFDDTIGAIRGKMLRDMGASGERTLSAAEVALSCDFQAMRALARPLAEAARRAPIMAAEDAGRVLEAEVAARTRCKELLAAAMTISALASALEALKPLCAEREVAKHTQRLAGMRAPFVLGVIVVHAAGASAGMNPASISPLSPKSGRLPTPLSPPSNRLASPFSPKSGARCGTGSLVDVTVTGELAVKALQAEVAKRLSVPAHRVKLSREDGSLLRVGASLDENDIRSSVRLRAYIVEEPKLLRLQQDKLFSAKDRILFSPQEAEVGFEGGYCNFGSVGRRSEWSVPSYRVIEVHWPSKAAPEGMLRLTFDPPDEHGWLSVATDNRGVTWRCIS